MQQDPVCGMMVDERRSQLRSEYGGTTYYFCSVACKSTFEKDPQRYARRDQSRSC